MNTIKNIEKINLNEMKYGITQAGSWHKDYDSAYIFVGGLNYKMNEGDIAIVFSQFGEIVDLNLVRDKATGKSKGFAFIAYQDQRSTILAVDNFNGVEICGRMIKVDHVKKYKPPKQYLDLKEEDQFLGAKEYKPTGPDGRGWGKFREYTEEEKAINKYNEQIRAEKKANMASSIGII